MVYVEVILAAFKAIPELIKGIRDLVEVASAHLDEQRKQTKLKEFDQALLIAKSKGDTSELEKLLGKHTLSA